MNLCIGELAELVGGTLTYGSLPPLAGPYEPVNRIVVDSREAQPGDVYWALLGVGYDGGRLAEDAYLHGALGVVASSRHVEPWGGKFSLHVSDANAALIDLATHQLVRPARRRRAMGSRDGTTHLVRALLAGQPVRLDSVIERLSERTASFVA
jgi:UDP-N-acetylmuramyl pentapeptide synthase